MRGEDVECWCCWWWWDAMRWGIRKAQENQGVEPGEHKEGTQTKLLKTTFNEKRREAEEEGKKKQQRNKMKKMHNNNKCLNKCVSGCL